MPYYAVKSGRNPGVYSTWDECRENVDGYPRASHAKFSTLQEAQAFAGQSSVQSSERQGEDFVVYTDGACTRNGRRGAQAGYGVHFPSRPDLDRSGPLSASEPQTNQRAELTAILEGLRATRDMDTTVEIRTDSRYGIGCATNWSREWERQNWNVDKKNLDLVKNIVHETRNRSHPVTYVLYQIVLTCDYRRTLKDIQASPEMSVQMNWLLTEPVPAIRLIKCGINILPGYERTETKLHSQILLSRLD